MNFREEIYRLFCVPKCTSCDSFLHRGENVLCAKCMKLFLGEKVRDCSFCFKPIPQCTCTPKAFKTAKIHHLFKVSRYFANTDESPTKKLIFSLKKDNLRLVIDFIASEISARLLEYYKDEAKDLIIVPIPRRKKNKIKYGYDHAFELSKRIAKKLSCVSMNLLQSLSAKEQKGLTREERRKNAKYSLKKTVELAGKRIVILDDIVTSGASMIRASEVLFTLKPKEIVGACFAISYRDLDLNVPLPF